ncbi:MAG: phosphomannomutase/phosphoglucomutase [Clostridiales bacterium]|nr:phosphomannomutase/phosphoglucomutase [Clostridiales bacterium]
MQLKNLKSGSDVRGVAYGKEEDIQLTDEVVRAISEAFVVWLSDKTGKPDLKIAVGHDSRLSADRIYEVVKDALRSSGAEVYACGLCSTPAMFMMTRFPEVNADGSIMITASHMPADKNGLKFFTKQGGLSGSEITELLDYAEAGRKRKSHTLRLYQRDYMQLYCDYLVSFVQKSTGLEQPLEGFKIIVDAGNGAGGFFADRVLRELGADTRGSQFLEPNGNFPNHIPNPENKAAMDSICAAVVKNEADLGIIFDTDVDRAAVVAADGTEINRNRLIALASAIVLEDTAGATIVTDSVTSDGLAKFIGEKGGVHHRFKRGYRNVIDEAVRLNREGTVAPLAIETSGHAAFKENFFLDDGAYLVTKLLIKAAQLRAENKTLKDLIADLQNPEEEREVRLSFNVPDFADYGKMLIARLGEFCESHDGVIPAKTNYEGFRANITYASGWFLLRMSVHDPIMVINMESDRICGVSQIARFLYAFLSAFSGIDTQPLKIVANS